VKVEYSGQATDDLRKAAKESRAFGQASAAAVEARFREIIAHIAEHPEAAVRVVERPGMRVIPLIRYPYKIFFIESSKTGSGFRHPIRVAPAMDARAVNCPDKARRITGGDAHRFVSRPAGRADLDRPSPARPTSRRQAAAPLLRRGARRTLGGLFH